MYKKTIIVTLLIVIGLVSTGLIWKEAQEESEIGGIKISRSLYVMMNPVEKTKYEYLIKNSLAGDLDALKNLIEFWCGGASLCYDHGETLVKVADRIGEDKFIRILPKMSVEERAYLKLLLGAGLEYGKFEKQDRLLTIEKRFPNLSKALTNS